MVQPSRTDKAPVASCMPATGARGNVLAVPPCKWNVVARIPSAKNVMGRSCACGDGDVPVVAAQALIAANILTQPHEFVLRRRALRLDFALQGLPFFKLLEYGGPVA